MKKYLMTGIAALALCAGFTACSHDDFSFNEEDYVNSQKAQIDAKYQQAFVNAFGQPAKNHTWGFGGYTTRGFSTNHNLWGDPNADGGKWNFKVPPALTERQKLRVKLYFQYNPWLTYEDPEWTDFFVQQVYKGGTSPIASQSAEVYPTGNGGSAIGGQQMDLLTVGTPAPNSSTNYFDHVNDFNNGDYNGGSPVPVLNTGASTNNYGTDSHPDQITLMLDSKSDCVGYWSSNGATGHNDRCALAGADVIDAWANSSEAKALNIDLGDAVYSTEWNRSFVGLDYDGVYGDNIYKKGAMVNGSWDNNAIAYAKFSDAKQKDYLWDGEKVWSFDEYIAAKGEYFLDKEGNKVPYTINERNMFIGTNTDLSGQSAYITRKFIPAYNREDDVIDLTVIQAKIDEGALPCDGKLYQWTKNVGGRDHVYSDWIVTLTKAEKQTIVIPTTKKVRILCEDMNASTEKGDFDFNDAVFDLTLNGDNVETAYVTKIEILHTGAQFDIEVDGHEVHSVLGLNKGQFGSGYAAFDPSSATLTAKDVVVKTFRDFTYTKENGEKVIVKEELILQAPAGKAPAKILVETDCQIPEERVAIDTKYIKFTPWVADPEGTGPFWK